MLIEVKSKLMLIYHYHLWFLYQHFIYKYEDNQKYLRPYEDPVPVVEDITGMRILKGAFLLFGGDEK